MNHGPFDQASRPSKSKPRKSRPSEEPSSPESDEPKDYPVDTPRPEHTDYD